MKEYAVKEPMFQSLSLELKLQKIIRREVIAYSFILSVSHFVWLKLSFSSENGYETDRSSSHETIIIDL